MNGHHLILGSLIDYLDGSTVDDTHDERYRQKIARLLVEQKGYAKSDIAHRRTISLQTAGKSAAVPVAFTISLDGFVAMLIHYGPGSLVTRHRPALAMGRLVASRQVPVVVVTNGEQADILEGGTGKQLAEGLERIPARELLQTMLATADSRLIDPKRAEKEARILMAFEVDDRCPCDTSVSRCALGPP